MEAAKKLQLYFISLQREDKPTKVEMLRKVWQFIMKCFWSVMETVIYFSSKLILYVLFMQEIALMEEELNIKNELIKKQENLIQEWKKELKDQLDKHKIELDRV